MVINPRMRNTTIETTRLCIILFKLIFSLSLQYSLFLYEVYNKQEEACELSKSAYEDARTEVVASDIEVPNDTQCVMVLLRDNVILWQSHGKLLLEFVCQMSRFLSHTFSGKREIVPIFDRPINYLNKGMGCHSRVLALGSIVHLGIR